jgi:hypothetical protein
MIAGHFGFAAVVEAREPQVPLWSLMLATSGSMLSLFPCFWRTSKQCPRCQDYLVGTANTSSVQITLTH